jgi:hypothetical protein
MISYLDWLPIFEPNHRAQTPTENLVINFSIQKKDGISSTVKYVNFQCGKTKPCLKEQWRLTFSPLLTELLEKPCKEKKDTEQYYSNFSLDTEAKLALLGFCD